MGQPSLMTMCPLAELHHLVPLQLVFTPHVLSLSFPSGALFTSSPIRLNKLRAPLPPTAAGQSGSCAFPGTYPRTDMQIISKHISHLKILKGLLGTILYQ